MQPECTVTLTTTKKLTVIMFILTNFILKLNINVWYK